MSIHLKRTVFFFCILGLGLGCCFGNRAMAQIDPFRIWIPGVCKDVNSLKRVVSGYVFEEGGVGVSNVGIYDGSTLLAITDQYGNYLAYLLHNVQYTLTPKKDDFDFILRSWIIPANGDDYHQINFRIMP